MTDPAGQARIAESNHAAMIRSLAVCGGAALRVAPDHETVFSELPWPGNHTVMPSFADATGAAQLLADSRALGGSSTIYVGPSAAATVEPALRAAGYRCAVRQNLFAGHARPADLSVRMRIDEDWPGQAGQPGPSKRTKRQQMRVAGMRALAEREPRDTWFVSWRENPDDAGATLFEDEQSVGVHGVWVVPKQRGRGLRQSVVEASMAFAAARERPWTTAVADKDTTPMLVACGLEIVGELATWRAGAGRT